MATPMSQRAAQADAAAKLAQTIQQKVPPKLAEVIAAETSWMSPAPQPPPADQAPSQ